MEKFPDQIAFRCKSEDRAELKRVSETMDLAESDVARLALRGGLKQIAEHGLRSMRKEFSTATSREPLAG